jgi:hypothetical protein
LARGWEGIYTGERPQGHHGPLVSSPLTKWQAKLFNKMAARAKISKQHLYHWFNFEIVLHKNFLVNSAHKLFRLSCPLFSNCAPVVKTGSTLTCFSVEWSLWALLFHKTSMPRAKIFVIKHLIADIYKYLKNNAALVKYIQGRHSWLWHGK